MFIREIMNINTVMCTEDMPLIEVYQLMLENNTDFIPVIDGNTHKIPIGIITEHDICLITISKGRNPRNLTAGEVMNTGITKAINNLTLAECSDLLEYSKTKKILVIDKDGALCGTLTEFDIEASKNDKYFEDLLGRTIAKEYKSTGLNRIF